MKTDVLHFDSKACFTCKVEATLSLRPLISYLKMRLQNEKTIKVEFYRFLLEKIEREEALKQGIEPENLVKYRDTLELIFTVSTPLMENEDHLYWALSTPVPDKIFFGTESFYDFVLLHKEQLKKEIPSANIDKERQHIQFIYKMILERFYDYKSIFKNDILYQYTDPETQLTNVYEINVDTKFVDIQFIGDELPELNFENISALTQEGAEVEFLLDILPLNLFKFDGFTVITLTDVTLQHAIDGIRDALVNHTYENEAYTHIIQALKTLVGNGHIEFGLLPFLMVNNKFVFDNESNSQSILLDSGKKYNLLEESFYALVDDYNENPRPVFFNNLTDDKVQRFPFLDVLRKNNVKSYSFLPIYYNNYLVGILEIYSYEELEVDDKMLARLPSALPLLGQLLQYRIEEFHAKMDQVLKDKFTALQPSVQWKFNEAVLKYLKNNKDKRKPKEIDTVTFKNLYPLFGAVDIRNSTVERNHALREDLKVQLDILSGVLADLRSLVSLDLIDKVIFDTKTWKSNIANGFSSTEETQIKEFLENEVHPMLKHIEKSHLEAADILGAYFEAINPKAGLAFDHRRTLEVSMQLINTTVSEYLDDAQKNLQSSYPCYFAKFRTDGVEYDIYMGQDIAPDKPFDLLYLKNLRLWQISSMVDIARLTNNLVTQMPRPLLTTQLIFIHSNSIDISFRNDERRFDVEGAYNIRYEVVKKRIDKVHIKGTTERLTKPGKIAMVYFNSYEAAEYTEYITYLQKQKYLKDDLEILDLQELQGVNGLKALRVGVNYLDCDFYDEKTTGQKRLAKSKPQRKVEKTA